MRREELHDGRFSRRHQIESGDHVLELGWRGRSDRPQLAAILHPAEERECPWHSGQQLAEQFLGFAPGSVRVEKVTPMPSALVVIGTLEAVVYSSRKWDRKLKHFIHEFGDDDGRQTDKPILAVAPDGHPLHVVGGGYTVNERGIVG